jgi:hypothetical protein
MKQRLNAAVRVSEPCERIMLAYVAVRIGGVLQFSFVQVSLALVVTMNDAMELGFHIAIHPRCDLI